MRRGFISIMLLSASTSAVAIVDDHILGIHVHDSTHITAAATGGYTAIRFWDTRTTWSDIEPSRNKFSFERLNTLLAQSEKANLKVLWTLGSTPRWVSARPNEQCAYGYGCAAEPSDIEEWRHYVATVALTYKGRIECYEPWNEISFPNDPAFAQAGAGGEPDQFFSGSVETMVSLAKVAYEEIKRVDAKACVTTPSFHYSGDLVQKLDRYLAAGGGRYADIASLHFYFGDEPEESVQAIRALRRVLAKYGLSQMPVWNTEVGVEFSVKAKKTPYMSREELVYAMALRAYLLNISEGLSRVYWYAWDNGNLGFFERNSREDFGTTAVTAAVRLLAGVDKVTCQQTDFVWQCQVSAGKRHFSVIWRGGNDVSNARPYLLPRRAVRWAPVPRSLPAGQWTELDGRPVIVESP